MTTPPATPGAASLEQARTGPYLIGRLVGVAIHLAREHPGMSCERYAEKIARGGLPVLPPVLARLESMLSRDLASDAIPYAYRQAFGEILAALGECAEIVPAQPWPMPDRADFVLAQHHQSAALTRALAAAS